MGCGDLLWRCTPNPGSGPGETAKKHSFDLLIVYKCSLIYICCVKLPIHHQTNFQTWCKGSKRLLGKASACIWSSTVPFHGHARWWMRARGTTGVSDDANTHGRWKKKATLSVTATADLDFVIQHRFPLFGLWEEAGSQTRDSRDVRQQCSPLHNICISICYGCLLAIEINFYSQ